MSTHDNSVCICPTYVYMSVTQGIYFCDVVIYLQSDCCHLPHRLSNLLLSHTSPQSRRCAHFRPSGETDSANSFLKHAIHLCWLTPCLVHCYLFIFTLLSVFSMVGKLWKSLKRPHMVYYSVIFSIEVI